MFQIIADIKIFKDDLEYKRRNIPPFILNILKYSNLKEEIIMKIEYDESELRSIAKVNDALTNGEDVPLFINELNKEYYLKFKVVDLGKANHFLCQCIAPNAEMAQYMTDSLGIDIRSIDYVNPANSKVNEIVQVLESTIAYLKGESSNV